MARDAKRVWNRNSPFYDFVTFMDNVGKNAKVKKDMFSRVKGKVLEVGIGTGHNLRYYPQKGDFTGIDISEKMLRKAEKKAQRHSKPVKLEVMDAQKMRFPDETFETVLTTCVFCSVLDPVKGLSEIKRVLKPGGAIVHVRARAQQEQVAIVSYECDESDRFPGARAKHQPGYRGEREESRPNCGETRKYPVRCVQAHRCLKGLRQHKGNLIRSTLLIFHINCCVVLLASLHIKISCCELYPKQCLICF